MNDSFGAAMAISGDTLVVGAPNESSNATGVNGNGTNDNAPFSGAAYVFTRNAGIWTQQAYLKASNTGVGDSFGYSVAVSGDIIVIGAPYEDSAATGINGNAASNNAPDSGAAYIFVRSGGTWTQQAYVKAANTDSGDRFGCAVGASGEAVVVGADSEDSSAIGVNGSASDNSTPNSGASYIFDRTAGVWAQVAYLKASNTGMDDQFGWSVAISANTVIVGAPNEDSDASGINGDGASDAAESSGAAYAFGREGGITWNQQAYIKGPHPDPSDFFGYSVAVSGGTAVVSAVNEDSAATGANGDSLDNSATDSGAAFVFVVAGGFWSPEAYLKASNTGESDFFGNSVAISGDRIVIGAPYEQSSATGINGNGFDNSTPDAGAAYQFERNASIWREVAYLKASNTQSGDRFGFAVAHSSSVAIGAIGESSAATGINGNQSDNSAEGAGATYVYTEGGQQARSLSVNGGSIPAGSNGPVSVFFFARGNENSISFSVNFDTTRLTYVSASPGGSLPAGSNVVFNSSQVLSGRVGATLTLPPGQSLAPGPHQILSLTLNALGTQGVTSVTFGDSPVARSFVQANGTPIPIDQVVFNAGIVTITPPLVVRNVRVVGTSIQSGASGTVAVQIDAVGNENGLGFSLTFDTTKLNYVSASLGSGAPGASLNVNSDLLGTGHLGISFDLPAGQPLQAGTQTVVNVVFGASAAAPSGPTEIAFSDSPTLRRLADINDVTLPAAYTNANVSIDVSGFEADTSPRPNGNGVVSLIDWVQTGRFAVGLDTIAPGNEYQRADCAPRETKGNGQMSLADWVQAGRYGARLDAIVTVGGPTGPVPFTESAPVASATEANGARVRSLRASEARSISVASSVVSKSGVAHAEVRIEATGVENAVSLGLSFDPAEWEIAEARPAGDALNATLIFKSSAQGSIVLALAMPPGQSIPRGTRTLIDVTFTRRSKGGARMPYLRLLEDRHVNGEVVDVFGNSLPRRIAVGER
jgi:hypothetical protein